MVGRPNVGKSTLVNRILGRRAAVVEDTPGVTRDRVSYDAEWCGTDFKLVDTGGWEADVEGIESAIASQAQIAVQLADAVILVVDGLVGLTDTDERIVKMLRAAGKPVTLAVNKVDDRESEYLTAEFWKMGLGEPYGISAMHGRGIGELLDAALDSLKKAERTSGFLTPSHLRRVARNAPSSTILRAPREIRSMRSSPSMARIGCSSIPQVSNVVCTSCPARNTSPRCVRRPRSNVPSLPWCCSMPPSRFPTKT